MKITLIRHGETKENKEDRFIGITDTPLNARGREQAHVTGRYLIKQNWQVDVILTSPLERAQETADILYSYLPRPLEKLDLLRERNYGIFENKRKMVLKDKYPELFQEYVQKKPFIQLPRGESAKHVESRIHSLLFDVIPQKFFNYENILLVTHLNPIRATLHLLELADWNIYFRSFHNASITSIETNLKKSELITLDYSCFEDVLCND